MRNKILFVCLLALLVGSNQAKAQSTEEILGAIAGGALGSTIGNGDGKKAATVIGAVIGYRLGETILNPRDKVYFMDMDYDDFSRYCNGEVPYKYVEHDNLRSQWVRGCVDRLKRKQRELERDAYKEGLQGY